MILPDELVDLISEFSKPMFPYFKEYNAVLRVRHLSEWPELKQKLCGNEAGVCVQVIEDYLEACQFHNETYQEYESLSFIHKDFDDLSQQEHDDWVIYQKKCDYSLWYLSACSHELKCLIQGTRSFFPDYESWINLR
jgi:hypothetical protein